MKKIFLLTSIYFIGLLSFCQRPGDPINYLVNNNDFINWVSNVTNNEWDIQVDFKNQLGEKVNAFKKVLLGTQTNDEVNNVISNFGLDPEFSDQKMAEHIVFGLYFKQENPWLWELAESERVQLIRDAYFKGMSSVDPRWTSIQSNLLNKIQVHCGTTGRITGAEIANCFWDVVVGAAGILTGITTAVTAINSGNWSAAVSAVKKVLKGAARKFGWVGLAIAAIDVALCLWDANGD
jgi:hypothetical protein